MECPRCGFEQPDSAECISCGVIVDKYLATVGEATRAEGEPAGGEAAQPAAEALPLADESAPPPEEAAEGAEGHPDEPGEGEADVAPEAPEQPAVLGPSAIPTRPGLFRRDSRADDPIGRTAAIIRGVAAVACLGIALLMVINGRGLVSWWPYAIMIFYGAAALWGLTTVRTGVTLQQFATEMTVLVLVTLGLRAASPEMFSVATEPQTRIASTDIGEPTLPDTPLGTFVGASTSFLGAGDTLLRGDGPLPADRWDDVVGRLDFERIRTRYDRMNDESKARVYDVWKSLSELGPVLAALPDRHREETEGGYTLAVPADEREAIARGLDEAIERAERLRARVLVY